VRAINKLTDRSIKSWLRTATSGEQISDGGNMRIRISPAGTPMFQIKFSFAGKDGLIYSAGVYPTVSLQSARAQREWVQTKIREGKNPNQEKALQRVAAAVAADNTFKSLAEDWLAKRKKGWSDSHYDKSKRALERDVFPTLGRLPINSIPPLLVSSVIEAIDRRGTRDTAARVLQHINSIFALAHGRGLVQDIPSTHVHEVLSKSKGTRRRPSATDKKTPEQGLQALGAILREAEAASLSPAVRNAHRLIAFSVARIGNIVEAEWSEFRLEDSPPLWVIPRGKMKVQERDHDHKIVLGPTIAAELRTWRRITGGKGYLFPARGRKGDTHVCREAVEKAYRITLGLDGKHTPHGWRAAFSTLARDPGFQREVVELTLDHLHDNEVARAYDRGERLQQRIELANWWDAQLSQAERGGEVVPLKRA